MKAGVADEAGSGMMTRPAPPERPATPSSASVHRAGSSTAWYSLSIAVRTRSSFTEVTPGLPEAAE